jgi:hypothetical protein
MVSAKTALDFHKHECEKALESNHSEAHIGVPGDIPAVARESEAHTTEAHTAEAHPPKRTRAFGVI